MFTACPVISLSCSRFVLDEQYLCSALSCLLDTQCHPRESTPGWISGDVFYHLLCHWPCVLSLSLSVPIFVLSMVRRSKYLGRSCHILCALLSLGSAVIPIYIVKACSFPELPAPECKIVFLESSQFKIRLLRIKKSLLGHYSIKYERLHSIKV